MVLIYIFAEIQLYFSYEIVEWQRSNVFCKFWQCVYCPSPCIARSLHCDSCTKKKKTILPTYCVLKSFKNDFCGGWPLTVLVRPMYFKNCWNLKVKFPRLNSAYQFQRPSWLAQSLGPAKDFLWELKHTDVVLIQVQYISTRSRPFVTLIFSAGVRMYFCYACTHTPNHKSL